MNTGKPARRVWALRQCKANAEAIPLKNEMTVGREARCGLVLSEPHVSRKHAAFLIKDDKLYLQDTGSANGTFVNDHRVNVVVLKAGDRVRFDAVEYEVIVQAEPSSRFKAEPDVKSAPQAESFEKPPAQPERESQQASNAVPLKAASAPPPESPVVNARLEREIVASEPEAVSDTSAPAAKQEDASDRDEGVVIVSRGLRARDTHAAPIASLMVSGGAVAGQQFRLGDGVTRIGRDVSCEVTFNTRAVSALHAEIELVDGHWHLRDCDSSNGTLHNGRKITEAELADGDQLTFGDVELIFSLA